MKEVPLRSCEVYKSTAVFLAVMGSSPSNAITIEEMRRRVRVMDAIDAALEASADKLVLEEADHQMLKQAVSTFPFSVAHKDLLAILDDVVNAADALAKPV